MPENGERARAAFTTRARSSRSRVPRGKRSSRPTSSGAQGSRRSGGGLAPARRRAVALPASRVLSLGSALRGAALALLLCRERHDSPAEAPDWVREFWGSRFAQVEGNWRKRLKAVLGGWHVCEPFTATSRRNESDRRLAACTSVCASQFYTESTLGTSSESLVEELRPFSTCVQRR